MRFFSVLLAVSSILSIAWSYKLGTQNRQRYVSTASAARLYRAPSALYAKKRTNIAKKLTAPEEEDEAVPPPAAAPAAPAAAPPPPAVVEKVVEVKQVEDRPRQDPDRVVSEYDSDVRLQFGRSLESDTKEVSPSPGSDVWTGKVARATNRGRPSAKGIFADLEKDLESFDKRSKLVDYQSDVARMIDEKKADDDSIANKFKQVFSTVLIADFFVVLVFLLWFLLAAALQGTYPVVLERFQDIFQVCLEYEYIHVYMYTCIHV
jgi:hypothetical protein